MELISGAMMNHDLIKQEVEELGGLMFQSIDDRQKKGFLYRCAETRFSSAPQMDLYCREIME